MWVRNIPVHGKEYTEVNILNIMCAKCGERYEEIIHHCSYTHTT